MKEAARQRKVVYSTAFSNAENGPPTLFWLRIQWQRAELLRKLGRAPEAREIEAELRQLLAYADADHDILRKLRDLSQQEEGGVKHQSVPDDWPIVSPGVGTLRR